MQFIKFRLWLLDLVARLLGFHIKVDGIPYGAPDTTPSERQDYGHVDPPLWIEPAMSAREVAERYGCPGCHSLETHAFRRKSVVLRRCGKCGHVFDPA